MVLFKCKNCGGDLEVIADNTSLARCQYCESTMTIPKAEDEKKANLFNRANHHRINKEFDKALKMHEEILLEYPEEAEVYWGIVLCKFGIEFVDDPISNEKVPTCHRLIAKSIFEDEDYKKAIEYSDCYTRPIYEENAKKIEEIQKKILKISANEKPFDVFICYKENDENGERTQDSVRAQSLYDKLTGEGLRVFFARITLEDKLGMDYEPYIFAALNSAKAMILIGSKPEYFNAVWVRNEWSRYLDIIKNDGNKLLIPAYFNMNPYDMPIELSALQAQNMEKIGFEQELIRAINKTIKAMSKDKTKEDIKESFRLNEIENYLERAMLFLKDSDFSNADRYLERVLDIDHRNHKAYWGKVLCITKSSTSEDLYREEICEEIAKDSIKSKGYRATASSVTEEDIEKAIDRLIKLYYKYAIEFANDYEQAEYKKSYEILKSKVVDIIKEKAAEEERQRIAEEERIERERIAEEEKRKRERIEYAKAEKIRIEEWKKEERRKRIYIVLMIITVVCTFIGLVLFMVSYKDSEKGPYLALFGGFSIFSTLVHIIQIFTGNFNYETRIHRFKGKFDEEICIMLPMLPMIYSIIIIITIFFVDIVINKSAMGILKIIFSVIIFLIAFTLFLIPIEIIISLVISASILIIISPIQWLRKLFKRY